ncbi:MAG: hypothetical protein IT438_14760 [Phycisphaerales bacterium]|nr:hypothetical protein [Phycisphaerales bacterium]
MPVRLHSSILAAAAAMLAFAVSAPAGISMFAVEYDQFDRNRSVADGVLSLNEYQWGSQYFQGSGSGAGGVLGGPNSRLYFSSSDQGIVLGFQPGATQTGTLVVLVDAGNGGGRSAGSGPGVATLNDHADTARAAMSALRGRYPITSVFDDRYEYAVTFNADGSRAWRMPDDTQSTFTPVSGYGGATGAGSFFREALIPMGNGSWGSVGGFTLFAAYIDASGMVMNESLPAQPFTTGPNPGASAPEFTNAALVAEFIPSPATITMLSFGVAAVSRRRGR